MPTTPSVASIPADRPGAEQRSVLGLIAGQVAERPGHCAVRDHRGTALSYAELWDSAGVLAAELDLLGVGRQDPVLVAVDRSVEMVVALVGVARLGATSILLDPFSPPMRNQGILTEAGARVVIEAADQPGRTIPGAEHRVVLPLPAGAARPLEPAPDPESILYVAYTSGSTGRPKGVMASDRAVLNFVLDTRLCTLGPNDRVASLCNPASDATTLEVWKPLTAGATVVVLPHVAELDVEDWPVQLREQGITTIFLMAGFLDLVTREDPTAFSSVRTLIFGGEALNPEAAVRICKAGPPKRLVLGYGPTEVTVFATCFDCTPELTAAEPIPLGFGLDHYTLHVLDERLEPVPDGAVGELCIGGPGVASGYLGRPELTAERFVRPPRVGKLVYRSGDLVRRRPDGALDFVARADRQVKIRGYRIELEEVERAVLATGLASAAVVDRSESDPPHLVCVYTPAAEAAAMTDQERSVELSARLSTRLPGYMIPARWLATEALPFTSMGKVDRARLRAELSESRPSPDRSQR